MRLVAKSNVRKDQQVASVPPELFLSAAGDGDDGAFGQLVAAFRAEAWTGSVGVIALKLLRERRLGDESRMQPWISAMPQRVESPLCWPAAAQELARTASVRRLGDLLDDAKDDFATLEKLGWAGLPGGAATPEEWSDSLSVALSRAVWLEREDKKLSLVLAPVADSCSHASSAVGGGAVEGPSEGGIGAIGKMLGGGSAAPDALRGLVVTAGRELKKGDEIKVDFALHADQSSRAVGEKSAAAWLEEQGRLPQDVVDLWQKGGGSVQLSFALDPNDPMLADKELVLEDAGAAAEGTLRLDTKAGGQLDLEATRFLRLLLLQGGDTFILEPIFLTKVWDELAMPFSQENERAVAEAVVSRCEQELEALSAPPEDAGAEVDEVLSKRCRVLREGEVRALEMARDFYRRELEGLDLQDYYQERRLQQLGLDKPLDESEIVP